MNDSCLKRGVSQVEAVRGALLRKEGRKGEGRGKAWHQRRSPVIEVPLSSDEPR